MLNHSSNNQRQALAMPARPVFFVENLLNLHETRTIYLSPKRKPKANVRRRVAEIEQKIQ